MNRKRTRSWKHSVEGQSINHDDISVGRSQPEALIIHTYTHIHTRKNRVAVPGPCSQQHTHHHHEEALTRLTSSRTHMHTHTRIRLGRWFISIECWTCRATSKRARGGRRGTIWGGVGRKTNLIPCLPACLGFSDWEGRNVWTIGQGGVWGREWMERGGERVRKCRSENSMGKVVKQG